MGHHSEHSYPVRVHIEDILCDRNVKSDFINAQVIGEPVLTVNRLLCQLAATCIVISP